MLRAASHPDAGHSRRKLGHVVLLPMIALMQRVLRGSVLFVVIPSDILQCMITPCLQASLNY